MRRMWMLVNYVDPHHRNLSDAQFIITTLFCLQAFNPDTEFQFKNRTKHWDKKYYEGVFGADDCYALCPPSSAYYTSPSYKVLGFLVYSCLTSTL